MSAAFHFSLIVGIGRSVLSVKMRTILLRFVCNHFRADAKNKSTTCDIFVRLFVGGKVPALFEDNELCSGDGLVDVPGRERSDVHIVAACND